MTLKAFLFYGQTYEMLCQYNSKNYVHLAYSRKQLKMTA